MTGILVIGQTGQLARALQRIGGTGVEAWGHERFDLTATSSMLDKLRASRAVAVINAGAYTAVDAAEKDEPAAFALNRDGPAALAQACAELGLPLVHVSTDYVFDGAKSEPYVEADSRSPINVYGRSKAEGEDEVIASGGAVMRTSWVFSATGKNFVRTMLHLAETRDEVSVVADQVGRPTWADDLARACLSLVEQGQANRGPFHFAGADDASWADFAEGIFEEARSRGLKSARVKRISTEEFPTPAMRPANSRLDATKLHTLTGVAPRPWRDALRLCMDQMLAPD